MADFTVGPDGGVRDNRDDPSPPPPPPDWLPYLTLGLPLVIAKIVETKARESEHQWAYMVGLVLMGAAYYAFAIYWFVGRRRRRR